MENKRQNNRKNRIIGTIGESEESENKNHYNRKNRNSRRIKISTIGRIVSQIESLKNRRIARQNSHFILLSSLIWFINKGVTLETSAFQSLYGGQFTLSTPLINQIFVYHCPTDAAPQFLQKLIPFNCCPL